MRAGDQLVETVRHLDGRTGARSRALELIESVQLSDPERVFRAYPHQLSGGMRQRIMIALAIAGRPRLLVADEATTALDVTVQRGILELLMRLRRETGMSLVLVTHDLAVVEETSDHTAIVYAGVTVETGPTDAVIGNPTHPYTKALLSARPASVLSGSRWSGSPEPRRRWASFLWGAGSRRAAHSAGRRARRRRPRSRLSPPSRRARAFAGRRWRVSQPILTASEAGVRYPGAATPASRTRPWTCTPGHRWGSSARAARARPPSGGCWSGCFHPSSGSVLVDGRAWKDVRRTDPQRRNVQMIFQDPYGSLNGGMSGLDAVAEVLEHWEGLGRREARDRAGELLTRSGCRRMRCAAGRGS